MDLYQWPGIAVFQRLLPGPRVGLACALAYTLLRCAVGWWMDRRRLNLRL